MFNMGAWRDYLERMRELDDKVWRVDLSADKQRIAALESQVASMRPVVDAAIAYVNSVSQGNQYQVMCGAIEAYQREVEA